MTERDQRKIDRSNRAKIHRWSRDIIDQSNLENVLMNMRSPQARRLMYHMIKPSLKFESQYPDWLATYDPDMQVVIDPVVQAMSEVSEFMAREREIKRLTNTVHRS